MKRLFIFFLMAVSSTSIAQNQINTPAGQSLRINSDTMWVTDGSLRIDKGFIKLNNYRFISMNTITGTSPGNNVFIGPNSGNLTTTGRWNSFFGEKAGAANGTGFENTSVGYQSGLVNSSGDRNTFLGLSTGKTNVSGNNNTFIGYGAGALSTGSGNVFIGFKAGGSINTASNRLFIANSETEDPLIFGEFASTGTTSRLVINGRTGISTSNFPTTITGIDINKYQLFVKGGILTQEIHVLNTSWADYVFDKKYELKPLQEVEKFINDNKHLPNVPSAKQVEASGINLSEMARIQQEKIEELTLYLIEQDKQNKLLKTEMAEMKTLLKSLIDQK